MNFKRHPFVAGLIASLLLSLTGVAQKQGEPSNTNPPPLTPAQNDPTLELPKVSVNSARLADFPPLPKAELRGGGLGLHEPPVRLQYPGSAYAQSIPKGNATVCVELDDKGNPVDYLLVSYTEKYFGDALLRNAKRSSYSALRYKGMAIPYRFNFGYEFRPEFTVAMNSFDAITRRQLEIHGGRPPFKYHAVMEEELDNRLECVRQALPYFPDGYTPKGNREDTVLISFYVDEQGNVRIPSVDSASSPLLVQNAFKAIHYWQFKPPTVKGKPALVYVAYAVNFIPLTE